MAPSNMHIDTKKRWLVWVEWRCTDRRGGPRCCRTCSGPPPRWARQTPAWRRCSPSPPSQLLSSSLLGITRTPGGETGRDTPEARDLSLKPGAFWKRVPRKCRQQSGTPLWGGSQLHFLLFIYLFIFHKETPWNSNSGITNFTQSISHEAPHPWIMFPNGGENRRVSRIESRTHRRGEPTNQNVRAAVPAAPQQYGLSCG